jgi:D-glucuronyl C5-epimerase C-terminus
VEFTGSQLVWEYYPGQGIELQQLGSFSKAQWMCAAGGRYVVPCRALIAELVPLAARRAGGLTWEYYFDFDGGVPPWTSAMSQGTALQTFADAYRTLHDPAYLKLGRQALSVFTRPPPAGVAVPTTQGSRYLQYSFAAAPAENVINGFLQSLIGLQDFVSVSGDPLATRLFAAGDRAARAELPDFNTGAWSLYQPGEEDSLAYHQLVTGFLQQLCTATAAPVYCQTATAFQADLKTPPTLAVLSAHIVPHRSSIVRFRVSKRSRVGITIRSGGKPVFLTSGTFSRGDHQFAVPALAGRGPITVQLDATDLAGNYGVSRRASAT